jgi:hypothetical protein
MKSIYAMTDAELEQALEIAQDEWDRALDEADDYDDAEVLALRDRVTSMENEIGAREECQENMFAA